MRDGSEEQKSKNVDRGGVGEVRRHGPSIHCQEHDAESLKSRRSKRGQPPLFREKGEARQKGDAEDACQQNAEEDRWLRRALVVRKDESSAGADDRRGDDEGETKECPPCVAGDLIKRGESHGVLRGKCARETY